MTSNVKIQVMLPYKLGLAIEYTREPDYMPEKVFEGLYHLLVACTPSTDATDYSSAVTSYMHRDYMMTEKVFEVSESGPQAVPVTVYLGAPNRD